MACSLRQIKKGHHHLLDRQDPSARQRNPNYTRQVQDCQGQDQHQSQVQQENKSTKWHLIKPTKNTYEEADRESSKKKGVKPMPAKHNCGARARINNGSLAALPPPGQNKTVRSQGCQRRQIHRETTSEGIHNSKRHNTR